MADPNHVSGNGGSGVMGDAVQPRHDPTKYMGTIDGILRAMAHPVRRSILVALRRGGEMSASQAGEAIGLDGSRLADVSYQVRYLAERGCLERTRVEPAKRGNTLVRFYRLNNDYSALLEAIAELEKRVTDGTSAQLSRSEGTSTLASAEPQSMTRLPLRAPEGCSCSAAAPDDDGYCFNCTKPVATRAA